MRSLHPFAFTALLAFALLLGGSLPAFAQDAARITRRSKSR